MTNRPSLPLFLTEPARSAADASLLIYATPWLAKAPTGDGSPVLVLPGLLATDLSTMPLRKFLSRRGYAVHGWDLGRNRGPTREVVDGIPDALRRLRHTYGQPVSVIGWSLGGIYARQFARRHPDLVRQVITLGSPFAMADVKECRVMPAFNRHAHRHVAEEVQAGRPRPDQTPLPVPSTSVYSRSDGVVPWQGCRDPHIEGQHENVGVRCSHLGFGHAAPVLWLVADRLAQPADSWHPFAPPAHLLRFYELGQDARSTDQEADARQA